MLRLLRNAFTLHPSVRRILRPVKMPPARDCRTCRHFRPAPQTGVEGFCDRTGPSGSPLSEVSETIEESVLLPAAVVYETICHGDMHE